MWWFFVFCVIAVGGDNIAEGNDGSQMIDYHFMPLLFEMDDFDSCLRKPEAVYCVVDMVLLEDDTPLYQFIKNYSSKYYTNFNHNKLHRGICASQNCGLNMSHADGGQDTAEALKQCVNGSIHKGYGLQVDTLSVLYCKTKDDDKPPDVLDYAVAVLLLVLVLVNLGCSAFHYFWPSEKANQVMLAFCVQKNWKALKNGGRAEGGIFKCFEAFRFYSMVIILGIHLMMFGALAYTVNPEMLEKVYSDYFLSLFVNFRVVVQTFFVMSGFLMAYKMLVHAETHPFTLKNVPKTVFDRWLRLMPALLVVMGLVMTWIPRIGSGPLWDGAVKIERDKCRMNWWQLVSLLPNVFPFDDLCLPQTWFLGADTQLFLVTLIIMLIIWRWPKCGVPLMSAVMAISLIIPFLQSYFMKLLPIRVSLFPESIRDFFKSNDTFYYAYMSAQGNWAGYHLGVLTAYFYRRAQTNKWDLSGSFWMKLLFIASVPIAFGVIPMGCDLHQREASAFEAAVFNAMNQNLFALAICVFIIGYFYKCNSIYVGSVEWGPLLPLGRLSYCAMLLHSIVLRTYVGHLRTSLYLTNYSIIFKYAGLVSITFLLALPLYLFVEAPACVLQKLLLSPKKKSEAE